MCHKYSRVAHPECTHPCDLSEPSKRTTSCSSWQGHSNLHSDTGDEDGRDDNAKKSNSSTSSSVGGKHTPDIPTHRDPKPSVPDPTPISKLPSPGRIFALLHLTTKETLHLHPEMLGRIPGHACLPRIGRLLSGVCLNSLLTVSQRNSVRVMVEGWGETRGVR